MNMHKITKDQIIKFFDSKVFLFLFKKCVQQYSGITLKIIENANTSLNTYEL